MFTARTRPPASDPRLAIACPLRGQPVLLGVALAAAFFAAHPDARAQTVDPATLPAHDSHQGLLIAVSPDITAERSKAKFGKHTPYEGGILGLDVYFRNDNDAPIRINLDEVRLFIGAPGDRPQKLEPLSHQEVADLLLKPGKDPTVRVRSPLPKLGGPSQNKEWTALDSLLSSAAMSSDVLAPHATTHGYFYFDVNRQFSWLSNARLDIPDLAFMLNNKALFFFQIDFYQVIFGSKMLYYRF